MKSKHALILLVIVVFFLSFALIIEYECPIKFLGFHCPGCGLTRAFNSLLNLNFIEAIKYNILSIPILLFFLFSFIFIIKDIVTKKDIYLTKLNYFVGKYLPLIFLLLIVAAVINNINL